MKSTTTLLFWICCALLVMIGCEGQPAKEVHLTPESVVEAPFDTLTVLKRLHERGVLRAVTNRQHLNYHLIDGRPAGFQFELLDDFTEFLEVKLNLLVNDSIDECYRMLSDGQADLFAGIIDSIQLNDSCFWHLLIEVPRKMDEKFVWILPEKTTDTSLQHAIHNWMEAYEKKGIRSTFFRYFPRGNTQTSIMIDDKHISPYDDIIKKEAHRIHWDWRLIASIIYQESRFKPDLESSMGAYGLMQLMPVVMENYGIDYDSSPEDQIRAGGKLLQHIENELPESICDSLERQKFILASYNTGLGNIMEIRKKTENDGKDPDVWDSNAELYCPRQTYRFVRDVLERYSHYKALIEP